jgi:hypothetical protein
MQAVAAEFPGWGSVSVGQRFRVSASGEVRLLFDAAIMIRRSRRIDDALQTPTRPHADTFLDGTLGGVAPLADSGAAVQFMRPAVVRL